MGDWYDFAIRVIDGEEISGFEYQSEETGWQPVFIEMTLEQCSFANEWNDKAIELEQEKKDVIKSWIREKSSNWCKNCNATGVVGTRQGTCPECKGACKS